MGIASLFKGKELNQIRELKAQLSDARVLINNFQDEISGLTQKYQGISDIENEIDENLQELERLKHTSKQKIDELDSDFKLLNEKYKKALETYTRLKVETEILESKIEFVDYGIYEPVYDFERSDSYRKEQLKIIDKQKEMILSDTAAVCSIKWTVDGSVAKGRIMTNKNKKLLLRAFNGECDSQVAKVKWNNISLISERIDKIYERLNKLGESDHVYISKQYYILKKEELKLEYEYHQKVYEEKEEIRMINEERREEEKASREIEKAQRDAEREELFYLKALEKVKKEIEHATGAKYDNLLEKIQYLEQELKEASENKERAMSMAQQTRRGYVYIISNIGSYGENIYKIGMTRRLDPVDRIRELSNASVPFRYDIHAMILSEDAPSLESNLHQAFDDRKVNMINGRKEFFHVHIDEIEQKVKESGIEIEFSKIPEARDYRETMSLREKRNIPHSIDDKVQIEVNDMFPKSLYEFEVIDDDF